MRGRLAQPVRDDFKRLSDVHDERAWDWGDVDPGPRVVEGLQAFYVCGVGLEEECPPS